MEERIPSCSSDYSFPSLLKINGFSDLLYPLNSQKILKKSLKLHLISNFKFPTFKYYRQGTNTNLSRIKTKQTIKPHKNFLLDRLLWMLKLFIIIQAFCAKTTFSQQYTENERHILTGLLLKKFGLEELSEPIRQGFKGPETKLPSYIADLYKSVEIGEHDIIRHYIPTQVKTSYFNFSKNSVAWIINYNLTAIGRRPNHEWIYRADLRLPTYKLISTQNISSQRIHLYTFEGNKKQLVDSKVLQNLKEKFYKNTNRTNKRQKLQKTKKWEDFDVSNSLQEHSLNGNTEIVSYIIIIKRAY